MAQKCLWVKRTHANTIDNWRLRLKLGCPNFDVTFLKKCDFNRESEPIFSNIAEAFELFVNCYSKLEANYKSTLIFSNTAFCCSKDDNRLLDADFFGTEFYRINRNAIRKLTYADCFLDSRFRSIAEFAELGLNFTVTLWMMLRSSMLMAKKKFQSLETNRDQPLSVFLSKIKKGSKHFRNVIDKSIYQAYLITDLPVLASFCELVNLLVPETIIAKKIFSSWNQCFLDNNTREFIFKCRNNILRTGDRMSHILTNYDDSCFLCKCIDGTSVGRETFVHLFLTCIVTSNLILRFNVHFNIVWDTPDMDFNRIYWFGDVNGQLDRGSLLVYDLFRYQLWAMKQRRVVDFDTVIRNTVGMLRTVFSIRPSI
jgi:hypothetical protein